jgi:hypothetical protein
MLHRNSVGRLILVRSVTGGLSWTRNRVFLQAGHTPTLLAAFLYFDLAFMVWVMLGPLGVRIAKDLGLSHARRA